MHTLSTNSTFTRLLQDVETARHHVAKGHEWFPTASDTVTLSDVLLTDQSYIVYYLELYVGLMNM